MADYSLGTAEGTIKISYDGKGINQATSGMDELEKHSFQVRRSFQTIATTTGVAFGAIAAGIGFAVNSAIDFEKRISAIGAVSGATASDLEVLRKKALQLGADTVFSASDAASAMEELAKAGLSVTDIMGGAADATVALAAAGEIDLPQAATIAANAMNQFGLAAKDLPKVADLIAGAANASAIDVSEFGLAMQQAGAVANLTGLKFSDLAVAIALLGNAGIKGSDAGTSLKTMLQNLIPTTKQQIALSKELGLITEDGSNAFFDAAGNVKSLAQISDILKTHLAGLTAEQKSLALQTLFGSDAIRAAAILTNAGAEGFNNLADAMDKVKAADVAKARMDNVAGSIEQLKGSIDTAAIALGTALLPVIRKVTDFITLLVNKFSALDPKWQKLIAFAAVAAAGLLALVSAIAAVGAIVAGVAASLLALKIAAIITGIILAVIALAAAFKVAYDHSKQFRDLVASLLNVAKAVFGAIMAIVTPLVKFFKEDLIPAVIEIAQHLQKNLQPAFAAISEFVQQRILPAVNKLKDAFEKVMPTVIAVGKVILTVAKFIFEVLGKALGFIIPLLLKIIGPIFTVLIDVIAAVIGFIPTLVKWFLKFVDVIITIGKWIGIAIIAPFYLIFEVGKFIFEALMKVIKTFVDIFLAVFNFLWPGIKAVFDLIGAIIGLAFDVISALFQAFWIVIKAIWDLLWTYLIKPIVDNFVAIWNFLKAAFQVIVDIVNIFWGVLKAIWGFIWEWIVQPIIDAWNFISDWIGKKMDEAKAIVKLVWDIISNYFTDARDRIVKIVEGFTEFVTRIREHFDQAKQAALGKLQEIVDWVKGLPGKLLSALGD